LSAFWSWAAGGDDVTGTSLPSSGMPVVGSYPDAAPLMV